MSLSRIENIVPSREDAESVDLALKDVRKSRASENIKRFMVAMLEKIAEGQSISIVVSDHDYTTQEAADILRVSRTYLVKVLEDGQIPFIKVGVHRRIRAVDLMSYKEKLEKQRYKAMEELVELSQEIEDEINE